MWLYEMTFSRIRLEPVSKRESVSRPLTSLKHFFSHGRNDSALKSGSCGPEALLFKRYPVGFQFWLCKKTSNSSITIYKYLNEYFKYYKNKSKIIFILVFELRMNH